MGGSISDRTTPNGNKRCSSAQCGVTRRKNRFAARELLSRSKSERRKRIGPVRMAQSKPLQKHLFVGSLDCELGQAKRVIRKPQCRVRLGQSGCIRFLGNLTRHRSLSRPRVRFLST